MLTKFIPFLFVILWSSGFIGAQYGLQFAEPATFLFIRMSINIILFISLLYCLKSILPKGKNALHSLISGFLIHGLYLGGTYQAIALGMPSGLCALIVGIQPILTAIILVSFQKQRLLLIQWIGLSIGFIGISLVVQGNMNWLNTDHKYIAYGFASIALFGITLGTLYQKRYCKDNNLIGCTIWQYIAALLVFLPIALFKENMAVTWNSQFVFGVMWLVLIVSVAAVLLLLYMIKQGSSSSVASIFYLVPPMTALQAWVVFNEQFSIQEAIGFTLAAMAVYLVSKKYTPNLSKVTIK
ncbi:EamA family transporter [Aliivibrio fischeri]|uniref:DMT family transporter n=1 Tax=Aliivibrio fischeri TaxID=668 RepID=UPI0012D979BB|nr:DMT family transporter [Aliivibrio fischeri]MUK78209.1 EamA family transporter [Aliivibrio fischeri]